MRAKGREKNEKKGEGGDNRVVDCSREEAEQHEEEKKNRRTKKRRRESIHIPGRLR